MAVRRSLHRCPGGVGAVPGGFALQVGHRRARGRLQGRGHHLVLGVHLVEQLPGDARPLEVRPRDLVLALVVVGQLVVEVGPGATQLRRPVSASPSAEGAQRVHEAVEVAPEGAVDHLVHAHRRHRPKCRDARGCAEQGFRTPPLDRTGPASVRRALGVDLGQRDLRGDDRDAGDADEPAPPRVAGGDQPVGRADAQRRRHHEPGAGGRGGRRAFGATSSPQNTRMATVATAAASQPARPPPTTLVGDGTDAAEQGELDDEGDDGECEQARRRHQVGSVARRGRAPLRGVVAHGLVTSSRVTSPAAAVR